MTAQQKPQMTDPCPKRGFVAFVVRKDFLRPEVAIHMGGLAPQINGTRHLADRPKHKPMIFPTREQAEQFVAEHGTHGSTITAISHSVTCGCL